MEGARHEFGFIGGSLALDFGNTHPGRKREGGGDRLPSYDDLVEWGSQAQILTPMEAAWLRREAASSPARAQSVLRKAHALRAAIGDVFGAIAGKRQPSPEQVAVISDEAARILGRSRLVRDGARYRWDRIERPDDLDALLWPVARNAAELLVSGPLDRVRECASDDCAWLFIDSSRNRSRRWCDMNDCGNRAKAKRFYYKGRKGAGPRAVR